jgi:pimeloyl-ACP methyl ester carboxylesterase
MKRDAGHRERLLSGLPVGERRLRLAGTSTAVLEGGDGPPLVLLHGPGGHAASWLRVIPSLASRYRVIVPDLPGHGASEAGDIPDAPRVLDWLAALVGATCPTPPSVVGHALGGAIAASFAGGRDAPLARLVLVDALGLAPFEPSPALARALGDFVSAPSADGHDRLWERCAFDLGVVRASMGEQWDLLKAYNLDRAATPAQQAALHQLMGLFGMTAIQPSLLAGIAVPTSLIWGRHDPATPLSVAHEASRRYGWPLRVIENAGADVPIEQPEAFQEALGAALRAPAVREAVR